ncbi:MAG: nucleotide exchange factor GrpE [Anaerolineales bacterium]
MRAWLDRLLGKRSDERAAGDQGAEIVALEREVQSLRLDLQEQRALAERLKQELERARDSAGTEVAQQVQARIERLLAAAGAPVAQLQTQAHLLEEGQPVRGRDVMAVAQRLVRVLEDQGLTLEGSVGERVPFDPNRHEPLSTGVALQPGQPVIVRFVGIGYQGRLLRKAGVEPDRDSARN